MFLDCRSNQREPKHALGENAKSEQKDPGLKLRIILLQGNSAAY